MKIVLSILCLLLGGLITGSYYFVQFIIWGIVVIVLGSNDGIEFDIKNNRYRYYKSNFGITRGTWKDFTKYVNIVILSKTGTKSSFGGSLGLIYGGTLGKVNGMKDSISYIYIVDSTHRDKIEIASNSSFEKAKKVALRFEKELKLPLVKYSPVISQKTKNRIKNRR